MSVLKASITRETAQVETLSEVAVRRSVRLMPKAPEIDPRDDELAQLRLKLTQQQRDIDARDEALRQLNLTLEQTYADGEKAGFEAGFASATRLEEARLQELERKLAGACIHLDETFADLDSLALQVATTSLEKILEDADVYVDVTARAIRKQIQRLKADVVLAVELSAADFTDQARLDDLREKLGREELKLDVMDSLEPGHCRIRCTLGGIDLGVSHQWHALRRLLADIAEDEEGAA